MAETLKASWTKPRPSPPGDSILTSSSSVPVVPAFTSSTSLTPTTLDQPQQAGIGDASTPNLSKLPIKAKPPLPLNWLNQLKILKLHLNEEDHVHHRTFYFREDLGEDIGQPTDQGAIHIGLLVELWRKGFRALPHSYIILSRTSFQNIQTSIIQYTRFCTPYLRKIHHVETQFTNYKIRKK